MATVLRAINTCGRPVRQYPEWPFPLPDHARAANRVCWKADLRPLRGHWHFHRPDIRDREGHYCFFGLDDEVRALQELLKLYLFDAHIKRIVTKIECSVGAVHELNSKSVVAVHQCLQLKKETSFIAETCLSVALDGETNDCAKTFRFRPHAALKMLSIVRVGRTPVM